MNGSRLSRIHSPENKKRLISRRINSTQPRPIRSATQKHKVQNRGLVAVSSQTKNSKVKGTFLHRKINKTGANRGYFSRKSIKVKGILFHRKTNNTGANRCNFLTKKHFTSS